MKRITSALLAVLIVGPVAAQQPLPRQPTADELAASPPPPVPTPDQHAANKMLMELKQQHKLLPDPHAPPSPSR